MKSMQPWKLSSNLGSCHCGGWDLSYLPSAEASRRSLEFMIISLHARKHDTQGSTVRVRDGGVDQGSILGRLRGDERSDPELSVQGGTWVQRA